MSESNSGELNLILLPGMDGTGLMFKPLLGLLPTNIKYKIIPIPDACFSSHLELAKAAVDELPEGPCVILAESFSGRTAYELCLLIPEKIVHVMFVASFIDKPCKLIHFSKYLPLPLLKSGFIPNWCLAKLLFGVKHPPIALLTETLSKVNNYLLRNRLQILAQMDAPQVRIDTPCTIINATKDIFVNTKAKQSIARIFINSNTHAQDTGHFVLQASPREIAAILTSVIKNSATPE